MRNLMKLGIPKYYAHMAANSRRGHWISANLTTIKRAMTKERLINSSFYDLTIAYQSVHVNYWKRCIREPYVQCCERTAVSRRLLLDLYKISENFQFEQFCDWKPLNNDMIYKGTRVPTAFRRWVLLYEVCGLSLVSRKVCSVALVWESSKADCEYLWLHVLNCNSSAGDIHKVPEYIN